MTTLSKRIIEMLWEDLEFGEAAIWVTALAEDGRFARILFRIGGSAACH